MVRHKSVFLSNTCQRAKMFETIIMWNLLLYMCDKEAGSAENRSPFVSFWYKM